MEVACEYCGKEAHVRTMEYRNGRGFVCLDARSCQAREDSQAEEEES